MFRAGGKSGRGGAGAKRKIHSTFHSASRNIPSGGRPAVDASRTNRSTTAAPANETYSLATGNPLDLAMIIRLTPDLVDEIKRAESQGGSARIKFDANANNPSGNVIDVGGKDFRFTWSREMGDLCDIYEERQSGEDGNGLLVESGCAWRKLNVQRVLDESTKNHVKMRSEEAERKSKSRKVTILDDGSPSMKSQMKALAAAEATPWKMPFKHKKEPPSKKRKTEPSPGPPKYAHKHVLSTTTSKGRTRSLPSPSAHEQPHVSVSPIGTGNLIRSNASVEDNMPIQATRKEKPSSFEKGKPNRVNTNAVPDKLASKGNLGVKPTDLRSMLIFLLTENPRGMSLKALEKSVGQNFPNSGRQIKLIIKKIATYNPPGRYILKSGAEPESLQKPVSQSGSSPENNQQQTSGPSDKCDEIRDPENNVSVKTHTQNDEPANLNSEPGQVLTDAEKINVTLQSPDHYAEKKVLDNSEGPVAASSNCDSSNSESHNRSRSKIKSPVGSGSSSDSESDTSSNSKEGSDEEVDIMTSDDDKNPKENLQASEPELSTSLILCRPDSLRVQNATTEKENFHASQVNEITENSRGYAQIAEFDAYNGSVFNDKEGEQQPQVIKSSSDDSAVPHGTEVYSGDKKHFDDNDVRSKEVKTGIVTRAPMQSEDGYNNDKSPPKNSRDGAVDKNSTRTDSHHCKRTESPGKIKEVASVSNSHVVYPSKDSNIDKSHIINGRGLNFRRVPSDLELGELCDPLPEETPEIKKQSDKKGSIKQSENKLTSSDYWNLDLSKGNPAGRTGIDPVKPSSVNSNAGFIGNHEGSSKTGSPGHYENLTKDPHKQCHPPQLRRVNQTEVLSQLTNLSDVSSNNRQNETVSSQGVGMEEYGDAQRKVPGAMAQPHDDVQGQPLSTKSKRRKTNSLANLEDPLILDDRAGGTLLNNNNFSYCKYEKDQPELKGPIKDHSQYMEYAKEYQEKYDSYASINKLLESERNKFLNFGRELEAAKEKDMNNYYSILEELKESYRQCGTRHKRLKKVYVVLHRELETLKAMIKDYANLCPKA